MSENLKLYLKYAVTTLFSFLIFRFSFILDSIFVGRFISPNSLASISIIAPIVMFFDAIITMLTSGSIVTIGKYLGEKNVIISIIENGDSKDQTRKYLREFQQYLKRNQVINYFLLTHEIDDPRKKIFPFRKYSPLRIQFLAKLRNRCFDFLYKLPNIDFNNTKIIV